MPKLKAICNVDDCEEFVDVDNVSTHMETHGLYFPHQWKFKSWPDGTAVIVNTENKLDGG